jgi:hypothetical protein
MLRKKSHVETKAETMECNRAGAEIRRIIKYVERYLNQHFWIWTVEHSATFGVCRSTKLKPVGDAGTRHVILPYTARILIQIVAFPIEIFPLVFYEVRKLFDFQKELYPEIWEQISSNFVYNRSSNPQDLPLPKRAPACRARAPSNPEYSFLGPWLHAAVALTLFQFSLFGEKTAQRRKTQIVLSLTIITP